MKRCQLLLVLAGLHPAGAHVLFRGRAGVLQQPLLPVLRSTRASVVCSELEVERARLEAQLRNGYDAVAVRRLQEIEARLAAAPPPGGQAWPPQQQQGMPPPFNLPPPPFGSAPRPPAPQSQPGRQGPTPTQRPPVPQTPPPQGMRPPFGQAPQAPQQQPPPFVSSDEDELAEEEEGGALPGSGPASPDEWGLVRRAALTVGMVVPALVLAASLQRAGERAISEADRRAIVEAIREDVAVLEGYAETAAAYRVRIGLCGRGRGGVIS